MGRKGRDVGERYLTERTTTAVSVAPPRSVPRTTPHPFLNLLLPILSFSSFFCFVFISWHENQVKELRYGINDFASEARMRMLLCVNAPSCLFNSLHLGTKHCELASESR
ncbi:hypothetical protein IE53DRAFT_136184 [Violaceomyces palustris]|uniref:Uncharacterized protein n=1 Tax=Violaceomyces palustris TaxID=1673888 RepID=A0ACD0NUY4_9BASI|nr:hypothetical protein IE53DRAFT_136184 [Violaceomyces palustris]